MIVKLRRASRKYSDLSAKLAYVVLGIEADDFRILNDEGKPYLYPSALFEIVDDSRSPTWTLARDEHGKTYAYPPALSRAGFFEDYFDGKKRAVATFWQAVNDSLRGHVRGRSRAREGRAHGTRHA
jgi:hypothetical protein